MKTASGLDLRAYLTREPVIVALLSVLAVAAFLAVTGLSRLYHAQQDSLANRWFTRGVADLKAQRFDVAAVEFRAALLYSRDNYSYQLSLAEALLGERRTSEAYAYLLNLWDREPDDGVVNRELARIAAQHGDSEQALRYYNHAIYAIWPADQEVERRNTRLELIEFLLKNNAKAQAESQLIALAANLGDDPREQAHVGDLFVRAQDYERALAAYRASLRLDRHNPAANAGAGLAAFEVGRYPLAHRYLQAAVAADPHDARSADLLATTDLVLQMDPLQRELSTARRRRLAIDTFSIAGERLKSCGVTNGAGVPVSTSLADAWAKLKPQVNERGLQRDSDLIEKAIALAFEIEVQTSSGACGAPSGKDLALLLIAKQHESN